MLNRRDVMAGASLLATASSSRTANANQPSLKADGGQSGPALIELAPRASKLTAQIAPSEGGVLAGLQYRDGGSPMELLYRGRDFSPTEGWAGKAPILWPATGANFNDISDTEGGPIAGWTWDGKILRMPMHGFAMREKWQVEDVFVGEETAHAQVSLTDSAKTKEVYPFGFKLDVRYSVARSTVIIAYRVISARSNSEPMPFSAGNHITFKLPLLPQGTAESVMLTSSATHRVMLNESKTPTGKIIDVNLTTPRRLTEFGNQTPFSLSGCPSGDVWMRLEDPSGLAITVSHQPDWRPDGEPVLFNLWGDVAKGFFAPEPWIGKQNSLASGDGLILLPPGEEFNWRIAVDVGRAGQGA
jgi:galactose mutarotase-like enzyme